MDKSADVPQPSVAVVIPVYYTALKPLDRRALASYRKHLGAFRRYFVSPYGLDLEEIRDGEWDCRFPPQYFAGIAGYNTLMLSELFYSRFAHFDFILVAQLDAIVLSNRLMEFCQMGFDYIGAPWPSGIELPCLDFRGAGTLSRNLGGLFPSHHVYVGNGGLSLRSPRACLRLLRRHRLRRLLFPRNEDLFFSSIGALDAAFKLPPSDIASHFSIETEFDKCWALTGGKVPFGTHAWEKYNPERPLQSWIPADAMPSLDEAR